MNNVRSFALSLVLLALSSGLFAQNLSCDASPFGQSLLLAAEREAAVLLQGYGGTDRPAGLIYRGVNSAQFFDDPASTANLGTVGEIASVAVDYDGDGIDEMAYAFRADNGNPVVQVWDQGVLRDSWTSNNPNAREIQIVAAEIVAGEAPSLVVGLISGTQVAVLALRPDGSGGIGPGTGQANMVFFRNNAEPRQLALATGDFLLAGPEEIAREQVAVVIAGDPDGDETIFFDLLQFNDLGQNGSGTGFSSFNADVFASSSIPLNSSDDSFVELAATAGRYGFVASENSGANLAVVMQRDTSNGFPLEYHFTSWSGVRSNSTRQFTSTSRVDFARFSSGDALAVRTPRAGAFDITTGDLTRDGRDEMIIAYANDSGADSLSLRAYRYRGGDAEIVNAGDLSYPLSDIPDFSVFANDIDDVSIDAADTNEDGYAEIVTGIVWGPAFDLVLWHLDTRAANELGAGCGTSAVVGSTSCPGTDFLPFPYKVQLPIRGKGIDLGGFLGLEAEGEWRLCAGDSARGDLGTLQDLELMFNGQHRIDVTDQAETIPDATESVDACISVNYPDDVSRFSSAPPGLRIEDLQVEIGIDHSYVGDLTLELTSPRGTTLTLMNRPGRTGGVGTGNRANLESSTPITFASYARPTATFDRYRNPGTTYDLDRIAVALPDIDGDSTRALVSDDDTQCRTIEEDSIQTVIFMPPYFPDIQDGNELEAQIGRSLTSGTRNGVTTESVASEDFSGYFGASLGAEVFGIGAEISGRATAGRTYERITGRSRASESEVTTSREASVQGDQIGLAIRQVKRHDCYNYRISRGGTDASDSYARFCELIGEPVENSPSIEAWNRDVPNLDAKQPAEWAPISRDWENIALGATVRSTSGFPERAVDGLIDTTFHTDISGRDPGAFLIIDFEKPTDIHAIRLYVAPTGRWGWGTDFDQLGIRIQDGTGRTTDFIPAEAGDNQLLGVYAVETILPSGPIRGERVVISRPIGFGTDIDLLEVQVFGDGRHTPDRNPVAVCDPNREDDWFKAKVFVPAVGDFQWVDVAGALDWIPPGGECPTGVSNSTRVKTVDIFPNQSLDGAATQSWEMSNSVIDSLETNTGLGFSSRVGAEFDASIGAVAQLNAGGGYEVGTGVTSTHSTEVLWGSSLNVGGTLPGIPNAAAGRACDYIARPFAYRMPMYANTGFTHRALTIDYVVESRSWTHGAVPSICKANDTVDPGPGLPFADGFEG